MPEIATIGFDIAKNVFQLHGVDRSGQIVLRRALRRSQVPGFFRTLPPCLIGMEACATAHHWARTLMALRGHFAELGIVGAQGARNTRQLIALIHEAASPDLPAPARMALQPLAAMLGEIEAQVAKLDKAILAAHRSDPGSVRLATIPGIGPMVASCLSASIPDASLFQGSRAFAAYLGRVPRPPSTGGKPRLGSISKMGNRHLRKLLVVGAHAALSSMKSGQTKTAMTDRARSLLAKTPFKGVAVARANKMARIAWAVMAKSRIYEPTHGATAAQAAA